MQYISSSFITMQISLCYVFVILISLSVETIGRQNSICAGSKGLKFLWGDALSDAPDCTGPDGEPYPRSAILRSARAGVWGGSGMRQGRGMGVSSGHVTISPNETRSTLLDAYGISNSDREILEGHRQARAAGSSTCLGAGGRRLCRTRYNTTAPMYGVSLTSGRPVTIVQKFPDLLQQVVFEVCESKKCGIVRGSCTQTYVPYLFLVLPLGPVTLTGQDYVLVESGCVCRTDDDPDIDLASDAAQTSLNSVLP